jgi:hypothetical protein
LSDDEERKFTIFWDDDFDEDLSLEAELLLEFLLN